VTDLQQQFRGSVTDFMVAGKRSIEPNLESSQFIRPQAFG
jgi:hypothetical protein